MKKGAFSILFILAFMVTGAQIAPVTTAGRVTTATPGDPAVAIDITVSEFINIGSFTLTLKFDTLKIKFVSASSTPELPGMTAVYSPPSGNSTGKIIFSWTGITNASLENGSVIAGLVFRYVSGTGILNWSYNYGSICQYKRWAGGNLTTLGDNPKYQYYQDGGISNRGAPLIFAPVVEDPVAGPVALPLTVEDFYDISGFTLYFEYDPVFITYQNSFSKNPAFNYSFVVGDNPGFNGKRFLVIQWYGDDVDLSDGSVMCTLNFTYNSAQCNPSPLIWYDSGPSCEFADVNDNVLIDLPKALYYFDGNISAGLPVVWTGLAGSVWGDPGNWTSCGTPDITRNVIIPDVSPNSFPVINGTAYCKSIKIETGATLTVSQAGNIVVGE